MRALAENGSRYNLLNSAILELLEFIRVVCAGRMIMRLPFFLPL